jgi:predicted transcriptional regulator
MAAYLQPIADLLARPRRHITSRHPQRARGRGRPARRRRATNREIAQRLFISERTAQNHVQHILTKLDFTSRAQIAAWVTAESNE